MRRNLPLVFIVLAFAIILVWVTTSLVKQSRACEARGGVLVRTITGHACVDPR